MVNWFDVPLKGFKRRWGMNFGRNFSDPLKLPTQLQHPQREPAITFCHLSCRLLANLSPNTILAT